MSSVLDIFKATKDDYFVVRRAVVKYIQDYDEEIDENENGDEENEKIEKHKKTACVRVYNHLVIIE